MSHELKGVGFILRLNQAREADVIVRILLSSGEKISAFARAGLKSRKRFGGSLQPLLHVDFRATKKAGQELYILEETSVRHDFKNLKDQIELFAGASYVTELTDQCAHEGLENIELYNLLGATLRALEAHLPLEGVLRQFEVKLLSLMGWLPSFQHCSQCGRHNNLSLNAEQGVVTCEDCGIYAISISPELQLALSQLLSTSVLKNSLDEKAAQKVERVTRALLQSHWGEHKIKSIGFLASLRGFQK
jgi:DNA repair protein RecO (recombination protein O)